jgi:type III restriction enzyme
MELKENQFAKDCESSEQVEFYFKLPYWFEIKTPIGQYRSDWAVVYKRVSSVSELP